MQREISRATSQNELLKRKGGIVEENLYVLYDSLGTRQFYSYVPQIKYTCC
jgi:hypothetical protein